MTKKSVDEIVRGIPKRVRDAAPFKKGDGVEMTGSGKLGDVIESDEDMTLVEWRDGSESRVDTSKLNRFRSMREFKRDAAAVDRAVAKIPRRARDADYETHRFASGTRAQKVFESEAEAKALADQLKREGWQDVVVWHAASGWVARGMKDSSGIAVDRILAKIPRRGYSLKSGLDATLARTRDAGVRIVNNKLLGGWYVVRGPHQTPLNGRFDSKEEAQAWLDRCRGRDKQLDAALAKIPDRRAMDSFNKADVVTLKGSGKVGNVVESDEDMTLVAWHDGSESRVNTRKLKHADLARGHYGMGGNYDRNRDKLSVALAKIPRKR